MAPRSDNGQHGLRHAGDDAFQLTVDYLKQETIQPLKGLGRFLYMGIAGSFFLAGGILLVLIGIAVIVVAAWRITAGPARERLPEVEARHETAGRSD